MPSEIEEIRAAAEQGDPHAQFRLGWDYYIGNGVAHDKMEAVKWYTAAAGQGLRKAQEILDILEANKMLESEEGFADAEENELQTSAFRSRKWKALAAFMVLCAFLGIFLYYIGDNGQWFRKAAKIENSDAQSDLDVVDVEKITGDHTESTEALRTETQPAGEELPIEPNEVSTKTGEHDHETKLADKKPPIESAKSEDDTGTGLMERLAIFADKWLDGDSEPNEAREQEAGPAKRKD
jgi:uncharacterized protein YfiM (DUF2279 family)